MSKFFKSMFLLLTAGVFTATGWAETYTATNVSIATGTNGGSYDWAQFKFTDARMVITNSQSEAVDADAVSAWLDVTSVAILKRSGSNDWTNTIKVELRTSDGNTVLTNGTSGTLTTEDVPIGENSQKWMVFTFATPVRINKNMIYRIKTSSGSQQYFMSNVTGKTGSNNTSILASGNQDNFSPHVRIVATSVDLSEFSRTIASGENNWSKSDVWQSGGMNFASPTEGTIAKLSVTEEATLKMNASASVASMNISGNGSLTIAKTDSNKLTATTTTINADTTVNAGAASLGAVTIVADKTLTVKDNATVDSVVGGTLAIDATAGDIAFTAGTALTLDEIRQYTGKIKILGNGENGGTLSFADGTSTLQSYFTFDGGEHLMKYGANAQRRLFGPSGGDKNPAITVTNGATLTFATHDLSGWKSTTDSERVVILVEENSTLIFTPYNEANKNNSSNGETSYFNNRLILKNSSSVEVAVAGTSWGNPTFRLNGGTRDEATAQLAMLDNGTAATSARIYGQPIFLASDDEAGVAISTGVNATLKVENNITGAQAVKKYGAGTLKLTGQNTATGMLTVSNGTLDLASNWAGPVTLASSATLAGTGTIGETLTFNAGATIDATDGAITASGTVTLPSALKVKITEEQDLPGSVTLLNAANVTNPSGQTVTVMVGETVGENLYTVVYEGGAVKLTVAKHPTVTAMVPADGTLTLSEALNVAELEANTILTIDFGDKGDSEARPGTFTFNNTGAVSFAKIIVKGTNGGSITKTGNGSLTIGEFRPETDVTVTGEFLRDCVTERATITVPEAKTLSISVPDGGSEWDCALKQSFDGAGVVRKIGAGSLSLEDAYTAFTCPNMVVDEGAFRMASGGPFANYANAYAITVNNGAKFMLGFNAALTGNTTITLNDGATMECKNGNNSTVSTAAIVVNGNATIRGSLYGLATEFGGSVSGNGTLTLEKVSTESNDPLKFSGVIADGAAGTLKVVVNHPGGVTFTSNENTYTGGTEIVEGATLKLTATSAQTLSGNFSGSGALEIGDGTAAATVALTGLNEGYSGTITVAERSTLSNGTSTATVPFGKGSIVNNGLLKLTGPAAEGSTDYAQLPPVSGSGNITFCSKSATRIAGAITTTGTVTIEGTQTVSINTLPAAVVVFGRDSRDFTNASASIEGPSIAIGAGATLARNDEDSSVTIANDKTLSGTGSVSGTGTIGVPITFAERSVLDATSDEVGIALAGKVTGTIYVKFTAAKAVLTATSDAELNRNTQLAFASDEFAEGGYRFAETVVNTTHTFSVIPPLELPEGLPEAITGNAAAQNAIYDAVATAKGFVNCNITSVTAVTAESTGGAAGSTEALALFENLYAWATPGAELKDETGAGTGTYEGTVTVYYDFGISEMHVKSASLVNAEEAQLYVLLCAKVATKQNTTTANYASNTIVSLYRGTEALSAVEPTDAQLAALGITPAAGEKWFAVPMADLGSGTNAFTVKAWQTPQTEATP